MTKVENKSVKHTFSREEKEAISASLVQEMNRQEILESELAQSKSNYKAKIDEALAKVAVCRQNLSSGFEYRTIPCDVTYDFEARKKYIYRRDTGELAATEDMLASDMQLQLAEGGAR